jgi:large subunit ribosomal protein L19
MADEVKTPAEEAAKQETAAKAVMPEIKPGMMVRVHQKVKETNTKGEERERIQIFEGIVIAVKGKDARSRTITVRKVTLGVGVERIFPVQSTALAKIEVVKQMEVRRSKLYFTRTSKKKLKEKIVKAKK